MGVKSKGLTLKEEKQFLALINADWRMNGFDLKVAMAGLSFANEDSGLLYPKRGTIAAMTNVSEDAITKAHVRLVKFGYYTLVAKSNGGRNKPNVYRAVNPSRIKKPPLRAVVYQHRKQRKKPPLPTPKPPLPTARI
jgi:hypothetical protein